MKVFSLTSESKWIRITILWKSKMSVSLSQIIQSWAVLFVCKMTLSQNTLQCSYVIKLCSYVVQRYVFIILPEIVLTYIIHV